MLAVSGPQAVNSNAAWPHQLLFMKNYLVPGKIMCYYVSGQYPKDVSQGSSIGIVPAHTTKRMAVRLTDCFS